MSEEANKKDDVLQEKTEDESEARKTETDAEKTGAGARSRSRKDETAKRTAERRQGGEATYV